MIIIRGTKLLTGVISNGQLEELDNWTDPSNFDLSAEKQSTLQRIFQYQERMNNKQRNKRQHEETRRNHVTSYSGIKAAYGRKITKNEHEQLMEMRDNKSILLVQIVLVFDDTNKLSWLWSV